MKKFESNSDLAKEHQTIGVFCETYNTNFTKLPDWEIDYLVSKKGKAKCFVEVKNYTFDFDKYDTCMISLIKIGKMIKAKDYLPVVLLMRWGCGTKGWINLTDIKGEIKWGGRKPRDGAANDQEFLIYYPRSAVNIF